MSSSHVMQYASQTGGIQAEESGKSSPLVKKRQISSYCRHIFTFPAHLTFVSRSTSSMVLELSLGASSPKKRKSSPLVKKREISSSFNFSLFVEDVIFCLSARIDSVILNPNTKKMFQKRCKKELGRKIC